MTLMELADILNSFQLALQFAGPMPNMTVVDAISLGEKIRLRIVYASRNFKLNRLIF
jgi:hypothetical protein